ncbi:hypothetical protein N2152v2_010816 [Parachlorella kessleri]
MLGAALPVVVGLLWGTTNPLIRRGTLQAASRPVTRLTGLPTTDQLLHHLATPAFLLPQAVNLVGSALFAWSLGFGRVSVAAPVANGVSLAANAAVDWLLLGDRLQLGSAVPGLLLVLLGVTLCSLPSPAATSAQA